MLLYVAQCTPKFSREESIIFLAATTYNRSSGLELKYSVFSVDFVKKNSVHLIQRMGMVTVKQIADDLFASNVLSGEEMNTIVCEKTQQDASRMMIYMVLNKGSEACRILVKALEKQSPFLYQELHGYCKY